MLIRYFRIKERPRYAVPAGFGERKKSPETPVLYRANTQPVLDEEFFNTLEPFGTPHYRVLCRSELSVAKSTLTWYPM
jgi:hypothetical protein